MLKWMEFIFLGASLAVIIGLVVAGPKSTAPPKTDLPPLGAADPPHSNSDNDGHPQTS